MKIADEQINDDASLSVSEDNYTKYMTSGKARLSYCEPEEAGDENDDDNDDDDDDFDTNSNEFSRDTDENAEDEDEDEGNNAASEAHRLASDTSKNNHFFVWKIAGASETAPSAGKKLLLLRRHGDEHDSDVDVDSEQLLDAYDDTSSSDGDSSDNDEENVDEGGVDDEEVALDDESQKERDNDSQSNKQQQQQKQQRSEDDDIFFNEVIELLRRGLKENLDTDNVILEINSSKHANNIQIDDVCYYVARALLYLPVLVPASSTELPERGARLVDDYLAAIKTHATKYTTLLENYFKKNRKSQRIFLNSYMDFFVQTAFRLPAKQQQQQQVETPLDFINAYCVKVLHFLYNDCEFLSEDEIVEWHAKQLQTTTAASVEPTTIMGQESEDDRRARLHSLRKLQPFIDWLQEEDDDDDDDDDEEE